MSQYTQAECGQCGWIGLIGNLKDHPTRPMPQDLGFCPECGSEIEDLLTDAEARAIIEGYEA